MNISSFQNQSSFVTRSPINFTHNLSTSILLDTCDSFFRLPLTAFHLLRTLAHGTMTLSRLTINLDEKFMLHEKGEQLFVDFLSAPASRELLMKLLVKFSLFIEAFVWTFAVCPYPWHWTFERLFMYRLLVEHRHKLKMSLIINILNIFSVCGRKLTLMLMDWY